MTAAVCAAIGIVAGIAGAAAAPSSPSTSASPRHLPRGAFGRDGVGPAVHEEATVLNRAGTAFITATEDAGTVQSVSGDQLKVKEAARGVTYRTVTLTIPSGATVVRDFQSSSLSSLKAGDEVRVVSSSDGTSVFAVDAAALRTGRHHGFFAPGGRRGAWGPPGAGGPGPADGQPAPGDGGPMPGA